MKRTKDKKETESSDLNPMGTVSNNRFAKGHQKIKIEDLSSEDVVIGVMGPTGSGKSNFIEVATGIKGIVGRDLKSCTDEVSIIRFSFVNFDICLVDTPGFDDTEKSDVDIFTMISDWLNKTYKKRILLAGLLYFHRITDNRMAGTPLKNLRLFEKLCGEKFSMIVLTTTMWDEVEPEVGKLRERELQDVYWKSMINRGSTVKRFSNTQVSAFDVLRPIIFQVNKKRCLLVQKEMAVLGKKLQETTAGRELALQLKELVDKQQELLAEIRDNLMDSNLLPDQHEQLQQEYQEMDAKLQRVMNDVKRMDIPVGFFDAFFDALRVRNWQKIWSMFRRQ